MRRPLLLLAILSASFPSFAQPVTETGGSGLAAWPGARTFDEGDLWIGAGMDRDGTTLYAGFQPLSWAELVLRRDEPAATNDGATVMDAKVSLLDEGRYRPALALGFSGLGAGSGVEGEYLVLAKRFGGLDFHLGVGWGRFAGEGDLPNPFRALDSGFTEERQSGDDAWDAAFSGPEIGIMAGVAADTPIPGVTAILERGPLSTGDETSALRVGLAWQPTNWFQAGASWDIEGRVGVRATFRLGANDIPTARPPDVPPVPVPREQAPATTDVMALEEALRSEGIAASVAEPAEDRLAIAIARRPGEALPATAGRTARIATRHAGASVRAFDIGMSNRGLGVSEVTLYRDDIERTARHAVSAEEMWRTADPRPFSNPFPPPPSDLTFGLHPFLDLDPDGSGHRGGLVAGAEYHHRTGIVLGAAARAAYTDERRRSLDVERLDISWLHPFGRNMFGRISAGWFDEYHAGLEAELLYRPYRARWAVGGTMGMIARRTEGHALGLQREAVASGFLDLHYRPSIDGLETRFSVGRFTGGELGAELALARRFPNGVTVGAILTVSDGAERFHPLVRLSVPLHALAPSALRSVAEVTVEDRDADPARRTDQRLSLMDVTDSVSYRAISRDWPRLLQ